MECDVRVCLIETFVGLTSEVAGKFDRSDVEDHSWRGASRNMALWDEDGQLAETVLKLPCDQKEGLRDTYLDVAALVKNVQFGLDSREFSLGTSSVEATLFVRSVHRHEVVGSKR